MRIAENRVKSICAERGITVLQLLTESGVSKNAYYSLARRKNILPRSITAMADALDLPESELLDTELSPSKRARKLYGKVDRIMREHADADPDNVRHTLQLLDEKPVDRLRRALIRAQRPDLR